MDTVPSSKIYIPLSQNTTTNSDTKTLDHHSEDHNTEYIYICVLVMINYIIILIFTDSVMKNIEIFPNVEPKIAKSEF